MRGISVKKACKIVGGSLTGRGDDGAEILGVVIDSRQVKPGFAFAAFKGENTDGHNYVQKAFELGALCCFVEHETDAEGLQIVVPDTAAALAALAEAYRKTLSMPVVGITGSVGKTTGKEMIASVLSERLKVLKTEKNFNNGLGVPLTIFRIDPDDDAAVIEMGISDFGEMDALARMARPTCAVYTLIGNAHLDRLRDRHGVYLAKTEMLRYLPDDGTVFLNGDDDLLRKCDCKQKKVFFGLGDNCDVRAENIINAEESQTCDIVCGDRRFAVRIPAYGRHMVYAALEGAAVGIAFGLSDDEIASGIAAYKVVGRRASVIETGYITLIDDCYNANPDSVKCGIDSMPDKGGRKVCILGDMLEMGEQRAERHADIGRYAQDHGVKLLLCVGEMSKNTCCAADEIDSLHFENNAELISALPELIHKGDVVLVKASHSMGFDEIADALKELKL